MREQAGEERKRKETSTAQMSSIVQCALLFHSDLNYPDFTDEERGPHTYQKTSSGPHHCSVTRFFPPSACRPASDKPEELSEVMELRLEGNWMPQDLSLRKEKSAQLSCILMKIYNLQPSCLL